MLTEVRPGVHRHITVGCYTVLLLRLDSYIVVIYQSSLVTHIHCEVLDHNILAPIARPSAAVLWLSYWLVVTRVHRDNGEK